MEEHKLISIIVPVYNEAANLPLFYQQLTAIFSLLPYRWEIVFVDDGSIDESTIILHRLAATDARISVIEFTRNFGKEMATTAGLRAAQGGACLMLDADLQHPVEHIPAFLKAWESGSQVVVGVREQNQGEGWVKRIGSSLFYAIMNIIGETPFTPRATDFRLLDRCVVDIFCQLTEKNRMTRSLIDWLGFQKTFIPFRAHERHAGKAGYTVPQLFRLAISTFVANSFVPLKIAGYLGIIIVCLSSVMGLFVFVEKFVLGDPWQLDFSGSALLAILNLFLSGIILVCLGLMALYVGNIYGEVVQRPMYVIKNRIKNKESKS